MCLRDPGIHFVRIEFQMTSRSDNRSKDTLEVVEMAARAVVELVVAALAVGDLAVV